jgi:pilus assembly protein FimV
MFKKRALALAVASCLSFSPLVAEAAGIGKLTVLSGLGQPLKAELDVAANRDELAGMSARLAPQEAFRQAGIDYPSVLLDLRFALEKRANGQAVIKVTSVKPVNEPFLDFLVELNWPSGRLVREYTFLLDPPEMATKQASRSVAEARVVETVQGGGSQPERPAQAPAATKSSSSTAAVPTSRQTASAVKPAPQPQAEQSASAATRTVQQGDNLRKIAAETKPEGVSLDQMLVGLFQKNPDAFVGNNVNRLKAGAILGIPDKAAVEAVSDTEAKKMIVAQSADWNGYRQKLAAATAKAPAKEDAAAQSGSGKITAKLEEKAAPAEQAKDQVKVSRTEMPTKPGAGGKGAGGEAEQLAKEKALKEAQDRLALLEKNVVELQKLVEMKNQRLAELQQQAAVKKEEPKPVSPPKPVTEVKPVAPAKVVETPKPVETPPPAEPVKVEAPAKLAEEPKPVVTEKPVEAPKPVEPPKPTPPVKPPVPAPEPVPEPDFLDTLLEDPVPLVGLGGILALLGGFFMLKRRRNLQASVETTTAPGPSSLGPNSVFRMTGGQSVDTSHTPPQTGDFSQTGPGTIDTDEVDPVAEADVYMAYGRDTQAEEILLEALQKDPQRTAIHAKLLEIYANRGSLKQFETLASELYSQTGGSGPEWQKVAALGAGLDPTNPLYGGGAGIESSPVPTFDADATMIVSPKNSNKSTLVMPGALSQLADQAADQAGLPDLDMNTMIIEAPVAAPVAVIEAASFVDSAGDGEMGLDFDLGTSSDSFAPASDSSSTKQSDTSFEINVQADTAVLADSSDALDFDLGISVAEPQPVHVEAPDFSPEGTLVMAGTLDDGMDEAVSTFVGFDNAPDASDAQSEPVQEALDEQPIVDFDLDMDVDTPSTQTVVNSIADAVREDEFSPSTASELDHPDLTATVVSSGGLPEDSLEFDVKLTDSVFLGQPMLPNEFDIGSINLDLSEPIADIADVAVAKDELPEPIFVAEQEPAPAESASAGNEAHWEEVNTKLDLAKAYEEMGDLEGARELLQEVVGEGPVDLVSQARDILARIGE